MTDWKQLAAAAAPDIPADEMERIAHILNSLCEQMEAHAGQVPAGPSSAVVFRPLEGE